MKKITILFISLFLFFACSKEEKDGEATSKRVVEDFSSESFLKFNPDWNGADFILDEDGSLTIVGNTRGQESNFNVQPFILKLDDQKNISWTDFFNLDRRSNYRPVWIIPTKDQQYTLLTYSDPDENRDFYLNLFKYSPNGNLNWSKEVNQEDLAEIGSSIIQVENGDYMVLSHLAGNLLETSEQFLLHRFNEAGDLLWSRTFEEGQILSSKQLFYLPSDDSFIGLTEHVNNESFLFNVFKLHKFTQEGEKLWTKTVNTSEDIFPSFAELKLLENEELFLTYSFEVAQTIGPTDLGLMKLDTDGNVVWDVKCNAEGTEIPESLIRTNDGNILVLSNSSSYGNGGFDLLLSKVDPRDGSVIWDKSYGSESSDIGHELVQRENGNIVIMGNTNDENVSDAQFSVFILETDANGNPI